jgi:two-component system, sensor histidine kinase
MTIDANGPNSAERPPCVLNVDGDPAALYTRTHVLRAAGYAVVEAGSGAEALRLAGETTLDLVLLDVLLPDIDGHEVCRHLKGKRSFCIIAIGA